MGLFRRIYSKKRQKHLVQELGRSNKIYRWALKHTESKRAPLWIGLLFFLELILFIPLDAVLIFFCLQNRRRTFLYVLIAILASTLSALCGYLLGHLIWDLIGPYVVPSLISSAAFERFVNHYQEHENLTLFLGSLLPFPLKLLTLSAGAVHLNLTRFLTIIFCARATRFTLVGCAMLLWGDKIKSFVDRHFHHVLFLLAAKIAVALTLFWAFTS